MRKKSGKVVRATSILARWVVIIHWVTEMRQRRIIRIWRLTIGCLAVSIGGLLLPVSGMAQWDPPNGCAYHMPCPEGCFMAEVLNITADCARSADGDCCLFVVVNYNCRTQPKCNGNECGVSRRAHITIIVEGEECGRITSGWRCGDQFVRDGGGNSAGVGIILPPRCGKQAGTTLLPDETE